jgi:hypothetical protein
VDGRLFENASQYLRLYINLLDSHFPALKMRFEPHSKKRIGFIADFVVNKRSLGMYGFREIGEDDPEIIFIPVDKFLSRSNLSHLYGADRMHYAGSARGFAEIDVKSEVKENEIKRQLKKLIDDQQLNEDGAVELLQETLTSILFANARTFLNTSSSPERLRLNYPLVYKSIREIFLRAKFHNYFKNELIEQKIGQGKIKETWLGGFMWLEGGLTPEEEVQIEQKVKGAIAEGVVVPVRPLFSPDIEIDLPLVLTALEKTGDAAKELWITENVLILAAQRNPEEYLGLLKAYLFQLFCAFLNNYITVVQLNFPTLRQRFALLSLMPVCVIIGINPEVVYEMTNRRRFGNSVHILFCKPAARLNENMVLVCDDHEIHGDFYQREVRGVQYQTMFETWKSIDELTFSPETNIGRKRKDQRFPLHKLIYDQLRRELPQVLNAIGEIM